MKFSNLAKTLAVIFALSGTAYADAIDTTAINAGTLTGPTTLDIGAGVGPNFTVSEFSSSAGVDVKTQNGVGSTINVFTYDFKLGSGFKANTLPPELSLVFNGGNGLSYVPKGANVVLFDKTDGKALDVVAGTGRDLSLVSNLWKTDGSKHIHDTYEIALFLPSCFKGLIVGVGNVPIPGALVLFGSALAGLIFFRILRRKTNTAQA